MQGLEQALQQALGQAQRQQALRPDLQEAAAAAAAAALSSSSSSRSAVSPEGKARPHGAPYRAIGENTRPSVLSHWPAAFPVYRRIRTPCVK
jgi:hypothetical protein